MSDCIIETRDLSNDTGIRSASPTWISCAEGAHHGLLGRNGAGKTTTMKMLLGLTLPHPARCLFGQPLKGNETHPARIGSLIESRFYPNLTGTENLQIFATRLGASRVPLHQECLGTGEPALPGQETLRPILLV